MLLVTFRYLKPCSKFFDVLGKAYGKTLRDTIKVIPSDEGLYFHQGYNNSVGKIPNEDEPMYEKKECEAEMLRGERIIMTYWENWKRREKYHRNLESPQATPFILERRCELNLYL
jgi:hypothetical protein